jgi:RNA polymerase sigma-70 factor (ECF subfamily)
MRTEPLRWSTEDLLGEAEWLSRLARKLVGDPVEADDVVQDTWIAALKSRPERGTPLRPWLTAVARNFARMRRRAESAREVRERTRARDEDTATPAELAGRLEAQRALVEALARLREPYRSTVLLAYFEHRTSEEIAQRCSVSASTVRWRLKVAIDELRCELERERPGERSAWMLTIAPLARPRATSSSIPSAAVALQGALVMSNVVKIGAAAAAAVLIAAGLMYSGVLPTAWNGAPAQAPMTVTFAPIAQPESETMPEFQPSSREALEAERTATDAASAPSSTAETEGPAVVDARLLDEAGNPIAGGTLSSPADPGEPGSAARSDGDGRVRLELILREELPSRALEAAAIGYATHFERRRIAPGEKIHLGDLVLVPGGSVMGRVVDADRVAVDGVTVALDGSNVPQSEVERRRRFPFRPNGVPLATTSSDGSFEIAGVPAGFVRLTAGRDGWLTTYAAPVEVRAGQTSQGVELVLERVPADETISGIVVDPEGTPFAHAMVSYRSVSPGGESGLVYADENGRFEILVIRSEAHDLNALDPESAHAGALAEHIVAGTHDIVLQLRALPRIEVVVHSTDGVPIESFMAIAYDPDGAPTGDATGPGPHAGGRATLAPPTARFLVHVEAPGFALGKKGPFVGDAPERIDFALAAVPSLHGRVLADGAPVEGARIAAFQQDDGRHEKDGFRVDRDPREVTHTSSDESGEFLLTLRKGGRFVLRASAPDRAPSELELEDYDPRSGLSGVTLELTRGGSIEGHVLVPPGREPAGVIVGFSRGDGFAFTRHAESDGTYRAEHLLPGRWEVRRVASEVHAESPATRDWSGEPWEEIPSSCEVVEGRTTRFDLDLGGGATAAASVAGRMQVDGRPAGAWSVALYLGSLTSKGEAEVSTQLDPEGRFLLQSARLGPARLILTAVGGELDGTRFVVPIELSRGSNAWQLDLLTAKVSVSNVRVSDSPEDRLGIVWIGGGGSFAIRPLVQPGDGTLTVPAGRLKLWRFDESVIDLDPGRWQALAEIEVLPGGSATLRVP